MTIVNCPVCSGAMREMMREGILIDVCSQCKGVWLDRGELEKIIAFEKSQQQSPPAYAPEPYPQQHYSQQPQQPYPPQAYPPQSYPPRGKYDDDDYHKHGHYKGKPYRKRSALESIFDVFD